jgi:two-component system, NtrC family, sensor kinase
MLTQLPAAENAELLTSLIRQMPSAIAMVDRAMRYLVVSQHWLSEYGITDQAVEGLCHYDVFPNTPEEWKLLHQNCLDNAVAACLDDEYELPNGKMIWLKCEISPWYTNTGKVGGLILVREDITLYKHHAIAKRQNQQLLQSVIDNTNSCIFIKEYLNTGGTYLFINQRFAELFNVDTKTVEHKTDFDLFPSKIAQQFRDFDLQVLETGQPIRVEETAPQTDGLHTSIVTKFPIYNASGRAFAVGGIATDITDHKQKEKQLVRSQAEYEARLQEQTIELQETAALLQQVIDALPEFIFWKDKNSVFLGCNQNFARGAGYQSPQDLVGKTDQDVPWKHKDAAWYRETDLKVINTGHPELNMIREIEDSDGRQHCIAISKLPLRNHRNQIVGVLGTYQDGTEKRHARKELTDIKFALDQSAIVATTDCQGTILYVNDKFCEISKYSRQELLGQKHRIINSGYHPKAFFQQMWKTIASGNVWRGEVQNRAKDGTPYWVDTTIVPFLDAEGRPYQYVAIRSDISDRKQAEAALQKSELQLRQRTTELEQALDELKQAQTQLVQTEKMSSLGQLVAGVAHEINNPVSFIHGNVLHARKYVQDLLNLVQRYQQIYPTRDDAIKTLEEDIDLEFMLDDLPKLLSSMQIGTERIKNIVLALRNFSRMDEAALKAVNIHDGIDSTLMILQSRLKETSDHAEIKIVKQYGELPLVACLAGQLNQVFMNILANAIDALDEAINAQKITQSPTIQIESIALEQSIQIRISNNGPGIPEPVRARLFEPFFTTKPVGKGTGLGLSISYQVVVDKHHGSLRCESAPETGTTFIIEIPISLPG